VSARVDVAVAGGELATFRLGNGHGPPVLAIHGITSSSHSWCAVARELGGQATVIAPDLRGRGRSNELPGPYGIASHAADMAAVLEHFEMQPALVTGHSLGAYIAARLAVENERLQAEVVAAGTRCPIAGRISMDLIAVDVTDLPNNAVRRGHMVTLIGEGITVDELARRSAGAPLRARTSAAAGRPRRRSLVRPLR